MKKHSLKQIMGLRPCYTLGRVKELFGRRRGLDAAQIAALEIPDTDKRWALVRLLDARKQRLFACDCADRALARVKNVDGRSSSAVAVARRYAEGRATAEELRKSRAAAYAAATDATYADAAAAAAAADAAYAAAADAADATAADATYATYAAADAADAAYATYADADAAAAYAAAELQWQVSRLVEYHADTAEEVAA